MNTFGGPEVGDPLIYVDRSIVRPGKVRELRAAVRDLAALVEATEALIGAFVMALDAEETTMTVIHLHRDPASLDRHLEVAGPAFGRFAELINLQTIDIYGSPSAAALERLHGKAKLLGGSVTVHRLEAGFARLGRSPVAQVVAAVAASDDEHTGLP
jgi:quinol monooxygenase YgiN